MDLAQWLLLAACLGAAAAGVWLVWSERRERRRARVKANGCHWMPRDGKR
jgi:hypothetical protein